MVSLGTQWWCETDNQATTPFSCCPSTVSLCVLPRCLNVRPNRCQEDLNSFPLGELEETTRTPSYYMDEDYPARPEIQQPLPGWSNWCGSELSTLGTDVYIWRCALLVVHARKEEEEEMSLTQVGCCAFIAVVSENAGFCRDSSRGFWCEPVPWNRRWVKSCCPSVINIIKRSCFVSCYWTLLGPVSDILKIYDDMLEGFVLLSCWWIWKQWYVCQRCTCTWVQLNTKMKNSYSYSYSKPLVLIIGVSLSTCTRTWTGRYFSVGSMLGPVSTWMGDRLRVHKPSRL